MTWLLLSILLLLFFVGACSPGGNFHVRDKPTTPRPPPPPAQGLPWWKLPT